MFQIIGAMAEFERALIQERVRAGLRNARAKGRRLGRPRVIVDVFFTRRGKWGGLYQPGVRQQPVRAECQNRHQAVEAHHWRRRGVLTRRGEWGGLCRHERWHVCVQPEVKDGRNRARTASKGPA